MQTAHRIQRYGADENRTICDMRRILVEFGG